jgi:hypothetical protein
MIIITLKESIVSFLVMLQLSLNQKRKMIQILYEILFLKQLDLTIKLLLELSFSKFVK